MPIDNNIETTKVEYGTTVQTDDTINQTVDASVINSNTYVSDSKN